MAWSRGIGNVQKGEGYRLISLLAICYNLFATLLLPSLKAAGADTIIWPTQFRFRAVRGCADAVANLRCKKCCADILGLQLGKNVWLYIAGWPHCRPDALRYPRRPCLVIHGKYSGRKVAVPDAGHTSESRPQHFGIPRGCPLSPFLFSIVMTILFSGGKTRNGSWSQATLCPSCQWIGFCWWYIGGGRGPMSSRNTFEMHWNNKVWFSHLFASIGRSAGYWITLRNFHRNPSQNLILEK